jgi:ubiquinone/menaquinone biosynthesis C-methylase UbiE
MKLSRDISLKIHWVFDQLIPPILRDSRWFMGIFIRMAFRHRAPIYMDFKEKAHAMTVEEFTEAYRLTSEVAFERETDLNHASIEKIMSSVVGPNVLEVGCGAGFLCRKLSEKYTVSASDLVIQPGLREANPQITFHEADIEALPFADDSYNTVVCTHTLEHVRFLQIAISELRRVTKKRLIIVVPRQRPYKYTFDLHLNFFPYLNSFLLKMGNKGKNIVCEDADGDIFYREDIG